MNGHKDDRRSQIHRTQTKWPGTFHTCVQVYARVCLVCANTGTWSSTRRKRPHHLSLAHQAMCIQSLSRPMQCMHAQLNPDAQISLERVAPHTPMCPRSSPFRVCMAVPFWSDAAAPPADDLTHVLHRLQPTFAPTRLTLALLRQVLEV